MNKRINILLLSLCFCMLTEKTTFSYLAEEFKAQLEFFKGVDEDDGTTSLLKEFQPDNSETKESSFELEEEEKPSSWEELAYGSSNDDKLGKNFSSEESELEKAFAFMDGVEAEETVREGGLETPFYQKPAEPDFPSAKLFGHAADDNFKWVENEFGNSVFTYNGSKPQAALKDLVFFINSHSNAYNFEPIRPDRNGQYSFNKIVNELNKINMNNDVYNQLVLKLQVMVLYEDLFNDLNNF